VERSSVGLHAASLRTEYRPGPRDRPRKLEAAMKIKRMARISGAIALVCTLGFGGYVVKVWAAPASGVNPPLIGRGTYDRFMVNTSENQTLNPTDPTVKPFQYIAMAQALGKTEPAIDVEVDTHYYNPSASTGWHKHPGPVYITVTSGQLTFY